MKIIITSYNGSTYVTKDHGDYGETILVDYASRDELIDEVTNVLRR